LVRVNSPKREDAISEEQKHKNAILSKQYDQKMHPTVVLTDAKGKQLGKLKVTTTYMTLANTTN